MFSLGKAAETRLLAQVYCFPICVACAFAAEAFCLWRMPAQKLTRVLLMIAFAVFTVPALIFYALIFSCVVYGDCL